jgi:inosine triphosphate pyrophosphatase
MTDAHPSSNGGDKKKIPITFMTGNKGKLAEIKAILGDEFEIDNTPLDLPELQGSCVEEIAKQKALTAFELAKRPMVVIEDSCLGFNAHGGLPGPYVKWYLDKIGPEGMYKTLEGFEDKSGFASCIFALCRGPGDVVVFEGRVDGTIVKPRGTGGFGWDPLFQPSEGDGRTFGEYTKEEKNAFSHRRRGLEKLKAYLLEEFAKSPAKKAREEK